MLAITIGNFDGVHRGHLALVQAARAAVHAEAHAAVAGGTGGGRVVAVTFEPHPAALLRPEAIPPRLALPAERERLLRAAGADETLTLDPRNGLLERDPVAFLDDLRARVPFDVIVEGPDFRFGKGRTGSVETLERYADAHGIRAIVVDPVDVPLTDQSLVRASSSMIRWLLAMGRVRDAAALLGRPYALTLTTAPGDRRGRTIGFPTLNAAPTEQLLPMDGVYGGFARIDGGAPYPAAISIGTKPTFQRGHGGTNGERLAVRTCEAHCIGVTLPPDLYGVELRLSCETWIRDQRAFPSLDALVERIGRDVELVRARLTSRGAPDREHLAETHA
jgi:riboflavin kinase/FMN adenylyltransferase